MHKTNKGTHFIAVQVYYGWLRFGIPSNQQADQFPLLLLPGLCTVLCILTQENVVFWYGYVNTQYVLHFHNCIHIIIIYYICIQNTLTIHNKMLLYAHILIILKRH